MKVPPRPMFWCQVVATMVAGTVQLGVQSWLFTHIDQMCSLTQKNGCVFRLFVVVVVVLGLTFFLACVQIYLPVDPGVR